MSVADLQSLGATRRLIFENVANGVPEGQVCAAFRRSATEVERDIQFVAKKIREARFRTRMPPLAADDRREILFNRRALLETLRQLTDDYLASELLLPRIGVQALDSPGIIREASEHVHVRTRGL